MRDMDGGTALVSIGELARRSGLTVKTIRFWSDEGLVPPADRTPAGYRLYGPDALARLALVRTLRELGVELATVQRVLAREVTVTQVAEAHADALDVHIATLRLHRAVLRTVARRGATPKELELMNKVAQMSAEERRRLVHDFLDETFGTVDDASGVEQRMRQAMPELPDEPSTEQVEAWVELAELVQDPGFRARTREMAEKGNEMHARGDAPSEEESRRASYAVIEKAGAALTEGVDPASAKARPVVDELAGRVAAAGEDPSSPAVRRELADRLETFSDRRVERYWELIGTINGWGWSIPSAAPAYQWFIAALRASA